MKPDRKNSLPLYIQIREIIRSQIEKGEKKPLESFPSEEALCKEYGVSKITIKKALQDLKEENYIIRIKRKGTFVNFGKPRREKEEEIKIGENLFAFVVPDIEDLFISEIYQGIKKSAVQNGYQTVIFSSDKNIEKEVANIELLKKSNIRGAIILPCWGRFNALQILELKKRGYPFILVDRYFRDIQTDMVVVDNYRGAWDAVRYLIRLGHRDIGHIMGTDCTSNEDRFEGYRAALNQAGITFNPGLIRKIQPFETEGSLRFEPDDVGGYKEASVLLSLKKRPTAIFAGNDYLALGCCKAIGKMGLKIPDDISVVGFDDLKIASYLEVPLTTVKQPKYEIGKKAVELLIKKIKGYGLKKKKEKVVLPTELVIRESCGRRNGLVKK